jgi:predicted signal transduction protein with EAL and GGDEF domain
MRRQLSALIEIALIFASVATILAISIRFEFVENVFQHAERYEVWQIDELISVLIALCIALAIFFWRQSRTLNQEIAERAILEQQLNHQASSDALTGLPNRKLFLERLDRTLAHTRQHSGLIAILFLDLD